MTSLNTTTPGSYSYCAKFTRSPCVDRHCANHGRINLIDWQLLHLAGTENGTKRSICAVLCCLIGHLRRWLPVFSWSVCIHDSCCCCHTALYSEMIKTGHRIPVCLSELGQLYFKIHIFRKEGIISMVHAYMTGAYSICWHRRQHTYRMIAGCTLLSISFEVQPETMNTPNCTAH